MRTTWIAIALVSLAPPAATAADGPSPPKALIEFGWDEPDTRLLRDRLGQLERSPFDGCVFHVDALPKAGKPASLTWGGWGNVAFVEADVAAARDDLRSLRPVRFTRNFLRLNVTPGKLDWFDDHTAVVANARLAASLARDGRCAGVLLDTEQYEGRLFDPRHRSRPFDAYAAQARLRGREVMSALQEGFPDLVVLLTFGHSQPWREMERTGRPLAEVEDGLLAPFVDGMIEAARGKARIVDGFEPSYGYKRPEQFEAAHAMMRRGVHPIVADRAAYGRVVSAGFGLWLDHDWRKHGWDADDPSKNYFTPEAFEASVRHALERSDEFVWIYTETPRWWSPAGGPVKLHPSYVAAIRRARRGLTVD